MLNQEGNTDGGEPGTSTGIDLEGASFGDKVALVAIGSLPVVEALGDKFSIGEDKILRQEWTGPEFDVLAGLVAARK